VTNLPLLPAGVALSSYAGYFTVNKDTQSNLFFWLFEVRGMAHRARGTAAQEGHSVR
jgi:hypothetical protein